MALTVLAAAAMLIPLGGDEPAGVLGSLIWALALSVLVSRAVMLVVNAHEPPAAAFGPVGPHRFGSRRIGRP